MSNKENNFSPSAYFVAVSFFGAITISVLCQRIYDLIKCNFDFNTLLYTLSLLFFLIKYFLDDIINEARYSCKTLRNADGILFGISIRPVKTRFSACSSARQKRFCMRLFIPKIYKDTSIKENELLTFKLANLAFGWTFFLLAGTFAKEIKCSAIFWIFGLFIISWMLCKENNFSFSIKNICKIFKRIKAVLLCKYDDKCLYLSQNILIIMFLIIIIILVVLAEIFCLCQCFFIIIGFFFIIFFIFNFLFLICSYCTAIKN
jgi:hypothetical protein